jgi:hypothetical protein
VGEDPGALRHDVEDARTHLGETVDALAYKVSAPRRTAGRVSQRVRGLLTPTTAVAGGALLALLALRRRRR